MAVESEEILSKISDLINSKVDELTTNLNNFRQEASNDNQTLENAIGSIKSVIDEKLSKIDQISSEINSIQTSVQSVADNVSVTNNKIDNILSQQNQLQRTVDSVSQNIEKLSTVTSNQLTYLSNQSQNITEKVDKLSLQQERESRTAAVEGARGTVVVDSATGKTVSGVAAADATGAGEETKQSLIGSVLSGIKGILTSPLALGAALGTAALGTAAALRKEPPGTPQAGSDAELNIPPPDTSGGGRTGGQREPGPTIDPGPTQKYDPNLKVPKSRQRRINNLDNNKEFTDAVKRISEKHNVTREDIYGIIQGESNYNPTLLSPGGGYGGLFQMGRGTLYGKQAWGRSYSSNEIRKLSPVQQILMYEKLLDEHKNRGWTGGREGLPLIQAAPASLSKNLDPNQDLGTVFRRYGVGQKYWRANPGWRSSPTGPITSKSISDYYYRRNRVNPLQRQETETAPPPDARREPPQRQETSGYEIPDNVSFSSQSVERRASNLNEETKQSLEYFKKLAPPGSVVTSTYRSPRHPIERRKTRPGAHARGQAIDIRTRGVSKEDLQKTIQGLKRSGFNYILLEGDHIHAERRPRQEGFMIRNLRGGNPHISLSDAREAADQVELNDAEKQPDAKTQQEQQGYKEERSRSILPYFGINPAYGDETGLSKKEVESRNEKYAEEQYQKSLQQFESSLGKDSLGDDTGTVYDPTSSEIPKYLENMGRAMSMSENDLEGKFLPNIEKKQPPNIEKKQPLLNFNVLRDTSALGRMFGYDKRYVDKNRMKKLMEQSKMLQSMDDADLTPPKTKDEMNKILDDILKRARKVKEEAKKQAQQAPSQSQPVAGTLAGQRFFNDISHPSGENTPNNGVSSAPRPKHKIKLNQYIDPDTVIGEI
jgi:hypothetical protein